MSDPQADEVRALVKKWVDPRVNTARAVGGAIGLGAAKLAAPDLATGAALVGGTALGAPASYYFNKVGSAYFTPDKLFELIGQSKKECRYSAIRKNTFYGF